jgi:hypothetical protein
LKLIFIRSGSVFCYAWYYFESSGNFFHLILNEAHFKV